MTLRPTEYYYLMRRFQHPDVMLFNLWDLQRRGVLLENDTTLEVNTSMLDDLTPYERILIGAIGIQCEKDTKRVGEALREVEIKYFIALKESLGDAWNHKGEFLMDLITALAWPTALLGWIPLWVFHNYPWFGTMMWIWIFVAPPVAIAINMLPPPMNKKGRELLKSLPPDVARWYPSKMGEFWMSVRRIMLGRTQWLEEMIYGENLQGKTSLWENVLKYVKKNPDRERR